MPDFLHPGLLWLGLPLLGIPILIHLINLMRHRRVEWAAMEFLLDSQKKNSTWILLKQLLLLLLRIGAVAAVVLIVAQPRLASSFAELLGGTKTHHIVLLDDSYSMSDRAADTSAFDRAKNFVTTLARQAAEHPEPQTLSMLRFSRAGRLSRGRPPDFLEEGINGELAVTVDSKMQTLEPSQTDAGPLAALESVEQLFGEADDEHRVIYLVSDFRARQWDQAAALNKALAGMNESGAQVRLIHCVDGAHGNLAITSLKPLPGTRAAGVPLFVEVAVTNYGSDTVREVPIALHEDGRPRAGEVIEEITPGRTETRRFLVHFPTAGQHTVAASLPDDSVEADNTQYSVVDLPVGVPVLVIDGDAESRDGYFLATALNPGAVQTGLAPQIESPQFLNHQPLDKFTTIYLANVDRLDPPAIEALEKYVREGGGLGMFVGDLTDGQALTESLYRDGEGLLPAPLGSPTELLVNRLETTPDLETTAHPIFKIFAGERNSFLGEVTIERYFSVPDNWAPSDDSTAQVIASLRNAAPLTIEHKFGEGRVVLFLTTAGPAWNNWGQNPSFVVTIQELQAWLSRPRPGEQGYQVTAPLTVRLDPTRYQGQVRFYLPGDEQAGGLPVDASSVKGGLEATLADTDTSGVYRMEVSTTDGQVENRRFAFNVPPEEGDLRTLSSEPLAERLRGVQFEFQRADDFQYAAADRAGFDLSEAILIGLVLLLLGEQLLAYSASYHPVASRGAS